MFSNAFSAEFLTKFELFSLMWLAKIYEQQKSKTGMAQKIGMAQINNIPIRIPRAELLNEPISINCIHFSGGIIGKKNMKKENGRPSDKWSTKSTSISFPRVPILN